MKLKRREVNEDKKEETGEKGVTCVEVLTISQ